MKPSWRRELRNALSLLPANKLDAGRRIALLGVGNELNGDDAAGVAVVRALQARCPAAPQLLLLEAGLAPENFTGKLRRFAPDWVVLVDAAWLDEAPGCIAWVDWQMADGLSASTHSLPLAMFAQYVVSELGCRLGMLGIQPVQLEFGQPLSPAVQAAVDEAVDGLAEALGECAGN